MRQASSLSRLHDHSQTHHTRYYSTGRAISPSRRSLLHNAQQSQETDIHAPDGIRTRNPSQRLKPRGHRNRRIIEQEAKLSRQRGGHGQGRSKYETWIEQLLHFRPRTVADFWTVWICINKTGAVRTARVNVIMRRVRVTFVAMEKQ